LEVETRKDNKSLSGKLWGAGRTEAKVGKIILHMRLGMFIK